MEVFVLENPLKTIKVSTPVNQKCDKVTVNLVPAYLDILDGAWEVSLDTHCYKVIEPSQLDTVYEISTNLVNGIQLDKNTNCLTSNQIVLGHMHAVRL